MKYEGSYLLMTSWTLFFCLLHSSFFRSLCPSVRGWEKMNGTVFVRQTHFCPSLHLRALNGSSFDKREGRKRMVKNIGHGIFRWRLL